MTDRTMTTLQAVRDGLFEAMAHDERVIVYGEDVVGGAGRGEPYEGSMGGTFGATKGLWEEFIPGMTSMRRAHPPAEWL